ncbi:MAG: NADH-quinone oxidoreductase subunit A [Actinobacteria bacterium]|nr:NADH-quinone oxidoreductase subunit A [Actinomycetota bacterium]
MRCIVATRHSPRLVDNYLPLVVMLVLAVVFVFGSLVTTKFVAPSRPTVAKQDPYECGIVPSREAPQRFPVRFFLVAMIFIIFDIEIIFLYPWAVYHRELGAYGLIEMLMFSVAVLVSFLYLLSKGALDWGTVKKVSPLQPLRTSESSIRRVGLEGRPSRPSEVGAP